HPSSLIPHPSSLNVSGASDDKVPDTLLLPRRHVCPQRLDLVRLELTAPRWHCVLAVGDGIDEARALIGRKFLQIEQLGIAHALAVTGRAKRPERARALRDLLRREHGNLRSLGHRARAGDAEAGSDVYHRTFHRIGAICTQDRFKASGQRSRSTHPAAPCCPPWRA